MIWEVLAQLLSKPAVANFIINLALKHKYNDIGDYMSRYWLIPQSWGLPFAIRINHIKLADPERYLHDHPWNFRTVILSGWYTEEDVFGQFRTYCTGSTRFCTAESAHRIERVSPGGVWTLFITHRKRNRWGFFVGEPARKIHWRDFKNAGRM